MQVSPAGGAPVILLDGSKREAFGPGGSFKKLHRRLRAQYDVLQ
jgi:hypothetical protein